MAKSGGLRPEFSAAEREDMSLPGSKTSTLAALGPAAWRGCAELAGAAPNPTPRGGCAREDGCGGVGWTGPVALSSTCMPRNPSHGASGRGGRRSPWNALPCLTRTWCRTGGQRGLILQPAQTGRLRRLAFPARPSDGPCGDMALTGVSGSPGLHAAGIRRARTQATGISPEP